MWDSSGTRLRLQQRFQTSPGMPSQVLTGRLTSNGTPRRPAHVCMFTHVAHWKYGRSPFPASLTQTGAMHASRSSSASRRRQLSVRRGEARSSAWASRSASSGILGRQTVSPVSAPVWTDPPASCETKQLHCSSSGLVGGGGSCGVYSRPHSDWSLTCSFLTLDCRGVDVPEPAETEEGHNDAEMQSLTRTPVPKEICSNDDQEDLHPALKTISKAGGTRQRFLAGFCPKNKLSSLSAV